MGIFCRETDKHQPKGKIGAKGVRKALIDSPDLWRTVSTFFGKAKRGQKKNLEKQGLKLWQNCHFMSFARIAHKSLAAKGMQLFKLPNLLSLPRD